MRTRGDNSPQRESRRSGANFSGAWCLRPTWPSPRAARPPHKPSSHVCRPLCHTCRAAKTARTSKTPNRENSDRRLLPRYIRRSAFPGAAVGAKLSGDVINGIPHCRPLGDPPASPDFVEAVGPLEPLIIQCCKKSPAPKRQQGIARSPNDN